MKFFDFKFVRFDCFYEKFVLGRIHLAPKNLNLYCLDRRTSEIISNEIKLKPIPFELNIENLFLNFCVGVWVSRHPRAKFSHLITDAQESSTCFAANDIPVSGRGKSFIWKTAQTFDFTWVKIEWPELKSMKLVGLISWSGWKWNSKYFGEFWLENTRAIEHHPPWNWKILKLETPREWV